ncbi:MAG TPA: CHASE3 domain-containing protein [Longimicrobiales bacterium]
MRVQPPTRFRRLIATYGPVLVVLLLGAIALVGMAQERQRAASVAHTQRVQLALERTVSTVRAAESRQRGFLLTGDSSYLVPYRSAHALVRAQIDSIRVLTADNPAQQGRVAGLRSVIEQRMGRLNQTLEIASARPAAEVELAPGRELMQELQDRVSIMEAAEDSLLEARINASTRQARFTLFLVLFATLLAGLLALLGNMILADYAERQEAVSADLEQQKDELRRTTLDLERRTRAAEEANRAKADFLRAMSHELRTPLNAIGGYTQLIDLGIRGPVTLEQKADLARIARSQRHLLSLINDILNYAKLEAGRVSFELERIVIQDLINAVDEMVEPQMASKGIHYTCDAGIDNLAVIADREKFVQILLNLLSNAIKFTPAGGAIDMTVIAEGDFVAVRVSDTGPGIPADRQVAIFEPFVQVDRTLSATAEGTGLGLSISRELAQGMGGDLVVKSRPGEGSAFTLTVPAADPAGLDESPVEPIAEHAVTPDSGLPES